MKVHAFIPARSGSNSIKDKNLRRLGDMCLYKWVYRTACNSDSIDHIIVSTDYTDLLCDKGEIDPRPAHLCGDDTPITDVMIEYCARKKFPLDDILVLMQPTSPFIRDKDISACVYMLTRSHLNLRSVQTVVKTPHNQHYVNTRIRCRWGEAGIFLFKKERAAMYNKQRKNETYQFGNVVAVRVEHLIKQKSVFAEHSGFVEISWPFSLDVDTKDDLYLANLIVADKGEDHENWRFDNE